MKRFLTLLAVVFAAADVVFAAAVTPEQAKVMANAWASENTSFGAGGAAKDVCAVCDTNAAKTVLWYQVSMTGGGALMVAPVTEIEPVVAALEVDPGVLPSAHPLRGILMGDMRRRLKFLGLYDEDGVVARAVGVSRTAVTRGTGVARPVDDTAAKVASEWGAKQSSKWDRLLAKGSSRASDSVGVNDPIATEISIVKGFEKGGYLTHWNQGSWAGGYCYNLYTPNHAVCGCVATAAAALMQFFQVEAVAPYESSTCTYQGKKFEVVFGEKAKTMQSEEDPKFYDWSLFEGCETVAQIEEKLRDPENGEAARDVIGRLAYDAGVCLGMMWDMPDGSGSGAVTAHIADVLTKQFGFTAARSVSPKQEHYAKLIYAQIRAGVPVGMGIDGHAVVACGFGRDGDGVERVRVFMGWGGSGDAWYALPYIDTTSVMGGGSYLSEVVNTVITMVGKDDDKVVPVVGQVIPAMDADVTCAGVTTKANALGYFGLRVSPADAGEQELSCQGKTFGITLGTVTDTMSASALCAAIPDPVTLLLLNSEVAVTPMEAKAKALASGKPMLFFSGAAGDPASDAMWQLINDLDDQNVDDFTNKFVIAYFAWDPSVSSYSDGKPSYGVFDPTVYNEAAENRWAFFNGRLAYDNFAAFDSEFTGDSTNYVATAEAQERLMAVINGGYETYLKRHSGIMLTVVPEPPEVGAEQVITNAFVAGQAFTYTVPVVTNAADGVVYGCTGWELEPADANGVSGDTADDVREITFTPEADTAYTLKTTWEKRAVRVTCRVLSSGDGTPHGQIALNGVTNQVFSVWVAAEEEVSFMALADEGYVFGEWRVDGEVIAGDDDDPASLTVQMLDTCEISARFVEDKMYRLSVTESPKLASGTFSSDAQPVKVGEQKYLRGGSIEACALPASRVIEGVTWICGEWKMTPAVTTSGSSSGGGSGGLGIVIEDPSSKPVEGDGNTAVSALGVQSTLEWRWGIDVAATLAAKGWSGSDPTAAVRELGPLPAGVSAADLRLYNVPAGWQVEPAVDETGVVSVGLVPSADWANANLGIALTVATKPEEEVTVGAAEDIAYTITEGSATELTVVAPAAYTNDAAGWIWAPVSWEVTGDQTASGTGGAATFSIAENDEITLTWTWGKVGVRITAEFEYPAVVPAFHEKSLMDSYEEWRLFGESASFTVTNVWHGTSMPEALEHWKCEASTSWVPEGMTATVTARESDGPVTLVAVMGAGTYCQKGLGKIKISCETTNHVACSYGASSPAYGETIPAVTTASWNVPCGITLTETTQLVETVTWTCVGWELRAASDAGKVYATGTDARAQFARVAEDSEFVWLWAPIAEEPPEPDPQYAQPTPIAFTAIEKVADGFRLTFADRVKFCIYKLYSATTPTGFDLTVEPDQTMTAEADGPASFTVPSTGTSLFWTIVAEPGLIPAGN